MSACCEIGVTFPGAGGRVVRNAKVVTPCKESTGRVFSFSYDSIGCSYISCSQRHAGQLRLHYSRLSRHDGSMTRGSQAMGKRWSWLASSSVLVGGREAGTGPIVPQHAGSPVLQG
ncbi:hypothetical protein E2C01_010367 [Portunus trituberculatus]|uniref:Uncharacterized protein n=1 Tax=Portunus trituberculatus TaxID=210409 RepID=A0A5B7D886_PORTR|nr:hypothetical protein [Portunus trituberculatus]